MTTTTTERTYLSDLQRSRVEALTHARKTLAGTRGPFTAAALADRFSIYDLITIARYILTGDDGLHELDDSEDDAIRRANAERDEALAEAAAARNEALDEVDKALDKLTRYPTHDGGPEWALGEWDLLRTLRNLRDQDGDGDQ